MPTQEEVARIDSEIEEIASSTKVSASLMKRLVNAESQYNVNALGDTHYTCPKTGKIAPSRGLVQISECWHPEVSYAQAYDEIFALNFMAQKLLQGKCKQWSTCKSASAG